MSLRNWPKVILFGDSITQYGFSESGLWVARVADKLQRKCDVVNRGFSGYNSRWCKLMLPKLFEKSDLQLVSAFMLFLGANDANLPNCSQHVPVKEYEENLESMVQSLMNLGVDNRKIMLVSTPPCDSQPWQKEADSRGMPNTQDNSFKEQYAVACGRVASQVGCRFVDTYAKFLERQDWKDLLIDGLHFSAKGSEYFITLIWPEIEDLTKHLPLIMPYWADVDKDDPEKTFSKLL